MTIFVDIETYHDFFYIGFKRESDGHRVGVEMSRRVDTYDRAFVERILSRNETVGYNSFGYDLPLIWYSLQEGVTNEMLKAASDRIIKGGLKPWEIEDALDISIPWAIKDKHIDLMEPQPNAFAGLKILNGRMHGNRLQDLPYPADIRPTDEQMGKIADYCLVSDLDATHNLWNALAEPMEMRRALSKRYDRNFMSKSDSQIGETIVKMGVEKLTGRKVEKAKFRGGTTFRYPVPDWMRFDTPELQEVLERLRTTDFIVTSEGKVEMPDWLAGKTVTIGDTEYAMGIGGLHSTESNRAVKSDNTHILIDADVGSQYPSIILMLGLFPESMGRAFLTAYGEIKADRMAAKKRAKEIKKELKGVNDPDRIALLEAELAACTVRDKGGKISLNGVYGKLGSKYSALYAPHLMISVTLTGQLTLLMLIEKAEAAGIPVVSGNTDGVLFRCPREMYDGLDGDRLMPSALEAITSEWERITSMALEFGEYKAIYNQSVNSYFAIKPDGDHKRKGPLGNPWNKHPSDFDPVRGQLMKNPQATICSDAALALIKDGTPIEDTILGSTDIRDFVTVIKVTKGATWRDEYLGKTVRYYWGINGAPIMEAEPHATTGNYKKVAKTEGAIPVMDLPESLPPDIDYERYIAETRTILEDLGYYGQKWEPPKRIRLTKANRENVLMKWMVAP